MRWRKNPRGRIIAGMKRGGISSAVYIWQGGGREREREREKLLIFPEGISSRKVGQREPRNRAVK